MRTQKLLAVLLVLTLITSFLVSCNIEQNNNVLGDGIQSSNGHTEDAEKSTAGDEDVDPPKNDGDNADTDGNGNGNVGDGSQNDPDKNDPDKNDPDKNDTPAIDRDAHTDENSDGKCDDCGISVLVALDFYAINDLHGKFADTDSNVGVDELTTYLRSAYKTDDNVLILSSGDMWQGSFESNATKGMILTDWMNDLDFVSMTLGNHEYDWGEEYVEANEAAAEFPFLAINIYERSTNERVDYCEPSVVIERGGMRIGIIGAMGNCYSSIASDKVEDIYFKTGSQLTSLVKAEADRLRQE